jgi:hypothetical protein
MYIKIEHNDKTQMHHAKSYWRNQLKDQAFDLGIDTIDGQTVKLHFSDCTEVDGYVMNEQGQTIDRI